MIKINFNKILFILLVTSILQGCFAVLGGAAIGAAGAAVVYDQQGMKSSLKDEQISYQIIQALQQQPEFKKKCHIVVSTYHRIVLLAGQAPNEDLKQEITNTAKKIPGIYRLYNEITIQGPTSALTQTSDTWITTKVKTQLLAAKNLKSGQFKVVTENGVVYLMGIVTKEQADMAVNITKKIDGVQQVVKVFEYKRNTQAQPTQDSSRASDMTPSDEQTDSSETI